MNTNTFDTEKATTPEPGASQPKGKRTSAKKSKPAKKTARAKKVAHRHARLQEFRLRNMSIDLSPTSSPRSQRTWTRLQKPRLLLLNVLSGLLCAGLLATGRPSLETARHLLSEGSLTEAVATLRQIIAADPRNSDAHSLLGTALALQGMRSESIEQLLEAVRLLPSSASTYNTLGMVLSRFAEIKAARDAFEKALVLDPDFAEAHVNLSLMLAQAGELGAAGDHLDRAIQLHGNTRAAANPHYLRAKV
jgi:tetratricopeptide (TPR) repeat protein